MRDRVQSHHNPLIPSTSTTVMPDIRIDEEVYDRLDDRADRYGFESTDAYAEQILATVIAELEANDGQDEGVTDRLEDLGYL